ncbi:MAG: hypothetical protein A2806_04295 [Candidatus Terrybacteria bacterium RIFCSPHIGHO2_01_FULL_48_17]|uniref:Uncharacterized protein n=1 Tax=Candidatus Terrybacteria bacterium RIFCSPHIGHO2_01_FULL_48_17 TaxID=1802362 RepID=A0A1G2PKP7_9BACT|nr:MAG: hypothetical protein A2806_04295 [Candidatus Terrybacteria bacterium RIFCSPHIGHO2_01_FULL_48_17]OHA53707.1 MAG: hypothetical protein A3A30_05040 [Candidatus Terrybacteria bacterium RIFCSPLOWO2_01_FULL_48_14]
MALRTPSTQTDFVPISVDEFRFRTTIDLSKIPGCEQIGWIVSPKDIARVESVVVMPDHYRDKLLSSISLSFNRAQKPYCEHEVHLRMTDPSSLVLGQKFVYRPNYISIVEGFRDTFKGFGMMRGFTRFLACLIIGTTQSGESVLGHYLPPIVEKHGDRLILMDGVHRNYLARQAGISIECLVVENVEVPFPCTPHPWYDVSVIEQKPADAKNRYWDLEKSLFRDTKYVGIDG